MLSTRTSRFMVTSRPRPGAWSHRTSGNEEVRQFAKGTGDAEAGAGGPALLRIAARAHASRVGVAIALVGLLLGIETVEGAAAEDAGLEGLRLPVLRTRPARLPVAGGDGVGGRGGHGAGLGRGDRHPHRLRGLDPRRLDPEFHLAGGPRD